MIHTQNNHIWVKDGVKKAYAIEIDGVGYGNGNITGAIILDESINSTENIDFRNVEGASIEFSLINFDQSIANIEGKPVSVSVTGTLGDLVSTIPLGQFIATKPVKINDNRYKVVCYDYMIKFDADASEWLNNLAYPTTHREMLVSICAFVGVEYNIRNDYPNANMIIYENVKVQGVKAREILSWLQESSATFFNFNRYGQLTRYIVYNNPLRPSEGLFPRDGLVPRGYGSYQDYEASLYRSVEVSDFEVSKIDKVIVKSSEDDIGVIVGEGTNAYVIQENPLFYGYSHEQALPYVQALYQCISGIYYAPARFDVKGVPYIEKGDRIKVVTKKGNEFETFVFSRTLQGIQSLNDTIEAKGTKERPVSLSSNRDIIALRKKTNELTRTVDETRIEIADLEANTASTFQMMSDEIGLRVKDSDFQTAITLLSNEIDLRVTSGELETAISVSEGVILNQAGNTFTKLVDGSLTINKIGGGLITLSPNKGIEIKNASGQIVMSMDSSGNATFDGTVYADMIVGNVVADEVRAEAYVESPFIYWGGVYSQSPRMYWDGTGVTLLGPSKPITIQAINNKIDLIGNSINLYGSFYVDTGSIDVPKYEGLKWYETSTTYSRGWKFLYYSEDAISSSCDFWTAGDYLQGSDIRLKKDITNADISWVKDLNIVEYTLKSNNRKHIGIIANEYEQDFFVRTDKDFLSVDYNSIAMANVKYSQMLEARIENLERLVFNGS